MCPSNRGKANQSGGGGVDSLSVERNLIVGPDLATLNGAYTGLETYWVCGEDGVREVEVIENGLYSWNDVAMRFEQTGDVQVSCNRVEDSIAAVDLMRDGVPTATSVRLRDNTFEVLDADSDYSVRTDDAVKIKLGPANATRGHNLLTVRSTGVDFILENDADSTDVLNARGNYWYKDSTGVASLLAHADSIQARVSTTEALDVARVDVSGFFTSDPVGEPCSPPGNPGSSAAASVNRPQDTLDEAARGSLSSTGAGIADLPTTLELGRPYPNPSRAGVSVMLSVPPPALGRYQVRIYDVAGRLVAGSEQRVDVPGRFPVEWNGRSSEGISAASGVYFLHVDGPAGFHATRKLTVLE